MDFCFFLNFGFLSFLFNFWLDFGLDSARSHSADPPDRVLDASMPKKQRKTLKVPTKIFERSDGYKTAQRPRFWHNAPHLDHHGMGEAQNPQKSRKRKLFGSVHKSPFFEVQRPGGDPGCQKTGLHLLNFPLRLIFLILGHQTVKKRLIRF